MRKKIFFIVMASLCLNFSSFSQQENRMLYGLKIGDRVPNIVFTHVANYSDTVITTSKLENKVLLLDLWATWCGTCISRFPHIDSLQKSFQNQIQIILVNTSGRDRDRSRVDKFVAGYLSDHESFSVPFVPQSVVYDRLFPCYALPHYVWIGADRKIKAITGYEEVNQSNILRLIQGQTLDLPLKTR